MAAGRLEASDLAEGARHGRPAGARGLLLERERPGEVALRLEASRDVGAHACRLLGAQEVRAEDGVQGLGVPGADRLLGHVLAHEVEVGLARPRLERGERDERRLRLVVVAGALEEVGAQRLDRGM